MLFKRIIMNCGQIINYDIILLIVYYHEKIRGEREKDLSRSCSVFGFSFFICN